MKKFKNISERVAALLISILMLLSLIPFNMLVALAIGPQLGTLSGITAGCVLSK